MEIKAEIRTLAQGKTASSGRNEGEESLLLKKILPTSFFLD